MISEATSATFADSVRNSVSPVLLDTGIIVALLDRSERHHGACAAALREVAGPLITCEPVIAEACYLVRKLRGAPEAILDNVRDGVFQLPFALTPEAPAVAALMKKYRSVPMDLADACLVRLAEVVGTARILTLDSDFRAYRWSRRKRFEFVIELD